MQKDPFILNKFDGGWVTEINSDTLDPSMSPDMINADFSASGSIKKMTGFSELGTDSENLFYTPNLVSTDLFVCPNRNGDEWLFKV